MAFSIGTDYFKNIVKKMVQQYIDVFNQRWKNGTKPSEVYESLNKDKNTKFGSGVAIVVKPKSDDWMGNILETNGQVFYKNFNDPISIKMKVPIILESEDRQGIDFELHTDIEIEFKVQNQKVSSKFQFEYEDEKVYRA